MQKSYISFLFLFLLGTVTAFAQSEAVTVQEIRLSGNQRTKTKIVLRELDFGVGDTIRLSNMTKRLQRNERLLINTNLFNKADFQVIQLIDKDSSSKSVIIKIDLLEDWYIFPLPVLDVADRNFNVWWNEQNHAFNRLNIGLHTIHNNITGRKDYGRVVVEAGYTQRLQLEYRRPYLNEAQTLGFYSNLYLARNRETGYEATRDTLRFQRLEEEFAFKRVIGEVALNYRPALWANHEWKLSYQDFSIADSIAVLNPDFFLDGANRLRYLSMQYQFLYDRRDLKRYPMKGYYWELEALKEGFGFSKQINSLYVSAAYGKYGQANKWSWSARAKVRKALIERKQPYYNSRALGYSDDFIRGYEYYVIDGQDYAYAKAMVRYQVLNRSFNLGKFMLIKAFKELPIQIYWKTYTDHGYVNAPFHAERNQLPNSYLRSIGTGLDFILYHDFVFRYEYSINHLGEKGLYLHYNFIF